MKKLALVLLVACCGLSISKKAAAQTEEIAQLLLNVEKLTQFKQILSDMEKGYRILNGGYNTVKDLSEGNFSLHNAFLDGLMQVSPAVRNYYKVVEIIDCQVRLVKEYKAARGRFTASGLFAPGELDYLGQVYGNLLEESMRNLDELTLVVTANKLRMSDDERLSAIDRIHSEMTDKLHFLRQFNGNTGLLAAQRQREVDQIKTSEIIHGINE